jgi:Putative bacterial sensory transduction regulator
LSCHCASQSTGRLISPDLEVDTTPEERLEGRPEPEAVQAAARRAVEEFLAETGIRAERLDEGRWFLVLAGERKLGIGVHLQVGDRTMRVESFFMRAPEEQRERLYHDLLLRQASSYLLRFTLDENGDLFVVGQVPLAAVTPEEVDRVVGSILELCDSAYLPSVEICFASSMAAERAWRARLAAGSSEGTPGGP